MNAPDRPKPPFPLPVTDERAVQAIAHFMLMGRGTYDSPEEMAAGLLRRLAHEGYVVRKVSG